jgi:SAM-dependent methyltransferase
MIKEEIFDRKNYEYLAAIEEGHFWFRGRRDLVLWAMQKAVTSPASFLEIGCGTGYMLKSVAEKYPACKLTGTDFFAEGIEFARQRCPQAKLMQMDARNIPFENSFDVIGAFDVLEHIQDDEKVIAQIHKALKSKGVFMITVPQHPFLWSSFDVMSCHVRRYKAGDLLNKLSRAGFKIELKTSFMSLLFPGMLIQRLIKKEGPCSIEDKGVLNVGLFNKLFEGILNTEVALIKMGVRFGFGGSLLVVARKI